MPTGANPAAPVPAGVLQRYGLATSASGAIRGERIAREVGASLEYLDDRPYQPGDDPRAVDWRGYARTGRLTTRLFHAERATDVHVLVDMSPSMRLLGKDRWARALARMLAGAARLESSLQLHAVPGGAAPPLRGDALRPAGMEAAYRALPSPLPEPTTDEVDGGGSLAELFARTVVRLPRHAGSSLVIVISDLLDAATLQPLPRATRARHADLLVLMTLAERERHPFPADLELHDVETGAHLDVTPAEAAAYRAALHDHEQRCRSELLAAGARIVAATAPPEADAAPPAASYLDRAAFTRLVETGVLRRR